MEKTFKTIGEQIEILKSRNIIISDYDKAYKMLSKNNYYYLINGYNEIDTYIAYEFSMAYGHKNYLVPKNFDYSKTKKGLIEKFINDLNLEIQYQYKNSNEMITHYRDKYKYIPLWVLVRVLSFGKISRFYSLMKSKEQNVISKKYNLRINELKIILHNLTLVRNVCAHDEKLYDIKMKNRISNNIYHKKMKIENKKGNFQYGTRDLFSVVIILKLLLEKEQFSNFYIEIIKSIETLKRKLIIINVDKIMNKMGFPKNYKKLLKL